MDAAAATVEITRSEALSNRLRNFSVRVDGRDVGLIGAGQTLRWALPPGRRRIELALDFYHSPPLDLNLAPGDFVALECGDRGPQTIGESFSLGGLGKSLGSLLTPSEFLYLRPAGARPDAPGAATAPATHPAPPPSSATAAAPAAAAPDGPLIFLSYRRDDSGLVTARIRDRLAQRFGERAIFRDYDSIPVGSRFREHIQETIPRARVFLVVIGPQWAQLRDEQGRCRLELPDDPVRFEIETAMQAGVALLPVLVEQASMPKATQLPGKLAQLAEYNAVPIPPEPYFAAGMARLMLAVEDLSRPPRGPARPAFCTGCGQPLAADRRFCVHCGQAT